MVAGVEFPHEESRRRSKYRDVFTKAMVLGPEFLDLRMLDAGDTVTSAIVDIGLQHETKGSYRVLPSQPEGLMRRAGFRGCWPFAEFA